MLVVERAQLIYRDIGGVTVKAIVYATVSHTGFEAGVIEKLTQNLKWLLPVENITAPELNCLVADLIFFKLLRQPCTKLFCKCLNVKNVEN